MIGVNEIFIPQVLEEPGPENTRYDNLTPAIVKPHTTQEEDPQNLENYDPFTMEIPYEVSNSITFLLGRKYMTYSSGAVVRCGFWLR